MQRRLRRLSHSNDFTRSVHRFFPEKFVEVRFDLDMLQKRRGLIVNLSSVSGRRPVPLLGLYSGTKGFVDLFSR